MAMAAAVILLRRYYWYPKHSLSLQGKFWCLGFITAELATDKPAAFFNERDGNEKPLSENERNQQWNSQKYYCSNP